VASPYNQANCLWVRPGAYPKVGYLKGTSHGYAQALLKNIRLGWKVLPGAKTLAYYENL